MFYALELKFDKMMDSIYWLQVQKIMVSTLVRALRAVPGGYLCRVQEGDFKYMVAFCDAQVRD